MSEETTGDENENVEKEDFRTPAYMCDESTKDGFVTVAVIIEGLTTSSEVVFKGILPSIVKKPENAKIDVEFENWSLCLTVIGESGDLKWQNYQLKVDKLIKEIVAEESYYEVDDKRVKLYLCKKEDESWYPQMKTGLDVPEEPVDSDEN